MKWQAEVVTRGPGHQTGARHELVDGVVLKHVDLLGGLPERTVVRVEPSDVLSFRVVGEAIMLVPDVLEHVWPKEAQGLGRDVLMDFFAESARGRRKDAETGRRDE